MNWVLFFKDKSAWLWHLSAQRIEPINRTSVRANPVGVPRPFAFSAPPALLPALKVRTHSEAYSLGWRLASFPALNLRGSDKSEQRITEGAFLFFFLFGYSVDNKYMHFGWLLVIWKTSNQFGKLFPAVITSYIDSYFLEGGKKKRLACTLATKNTLLIYILLLEKA